MQRHKKSKPPPPSVVFIPDFEKNHMVKTNEAYSPNAALRIGNERQKISSLVQRQAVKKAVQGASIRNIPNTDYNFSVQVPAYVAYDPKTVRPENVLVQGTYDRQRNEYVVRHVANPPPPVAPPPAPRPVQAPAPVKPPNIDSQKEFPPLGGK